MSDYNKTLDLYILYEPKEIIEGITAGIIRLIELNKDPALTKERVNDYTAVLPSIGSIT